MDFRGFLFLDRQIFSQIFSRDFFSSFLWEKVPRKILQENPQQNPPKFIQQKSRHISAEGPGQDLWIFLQRLARKDSRESSLFKLIQACASPVQLSAGGILQWAAEREPSSHKQLSKRPQIVRSVLPDPLRAQRLTKIQDRPPGLKFSSEIEKFKLATHQTPIFWRGILEVEIENFKRD